MKKMKGRKNFLYDARKFHRNGGYAFPDWNDPLSYPLTKWEWKLERHTLPPSSRFMEKGKAT